jgi:hypothetical protein
MISTTRGVSAISGAGDVARDSDGSAKGGRSDAPSVFRRAAGS